MAINFTNATGAIFSVWGKLAAVIRNFRSHQATQNTAMSSPTIGVVGQLVNEPDIQSVMGGSYIGLLAGSESPGSVMQQLAGLIANRVVFRDSPQINQTLQNANLLASLQNIIFQMKQQGATVLRQTVAATPGTFTGTGNGVVVASVTRPQDGLPQENIFAETITVLCTTDSYNGGATEGNEGFSITGTGSQGDVFAFNWPLGSNATSGLSAIDGDADNSSGNILTNSSFNSFTGNAPDNWTIDVGTAGTQIFQETTLTYDGASALRILGDGSTLTQISQLFNDSTGTSGELDTLTQYAVNVWARRDGVAPAAGVLTIDLIDADNNTVIADEAGTNNSFTIDLTGLTTSYASYTGTFRTPQVLPDNVEIRLRLTTALTNGRSVYFDKLGLGIMTRFYPSGPYLACFAGSVPFVSGDYTTVVATNSRGAAGTLSTFQTVFACFFPNEVLGNELLLPSAASPSITDAAFIV